MTHKLWVEKYRPKTIDEYVFHDPDHKAKILELIEQQTIPQLLFAGRAGSGKTTLAKILIDAVGVDEMDLMTENASMNRGIDFFRDKVQSFASSMPMGNFKVIHLEEADRLTPAAQDSLKSLMEESSEYLRFIFTCNKVHKITPELRSRFQEFILKPSDRNDVLEYIVGILDAEQVDFSLPNLNLYIDSAYPDTRKIVNLLQQHTVGGKLQAYTAQDAASDDYKPQLLELINKGDWISARTLVCTSLAGEGWEDFYTFLGDDIGTVKKFQDKNKWADAILHISDHARDHTLCADPELNAAALLIRLAKL